MVAFAAWLAGANGPAGVAGGAVVVLWFGMLVAAVVVAAGVVAAGVVAA